MKVVTISKGVIMVIGERGLARARATLIAAWTIATAVSCAGSLVLAQPHSLRPDQPRSVAPDLSQLNCGPSAEGINSDSLPVLPIACTFRYPRGSFDSPAVTPTQPVVPPVVATPTTPTTPPSPATDTDRRFAYFPPGELAPADTGRGRTGDRKVYLPGLVYPIRLAGPNHAHMNSQIRGFGGHWAGVDVGGRECDPRNYDAMLQRDNYCEVRGRDQVMPLCPKGIGHRGQDIRPPKCEDRKWDVVAVVDGIVVHRSDWTMLTLKGDDGTLYDYLHMHPNEYRVTKGQRVRQGDVLGRVSKYMDSGPSTTIHLHFQARDLQHQYVPVFTSLVAAYRRSKGLDASVDANGNLLIDANFEIGARRPDQPIAPFTVWIIPNVAIGAGRTIEPIDVAKAFRPADPLSRVRYAALGLPLGLRLDTDKGIISGDVDPASVRGGVDGLHTIKVTATDTQNRQATQNFVIRVGAATPKVVAAIQPRFVKEGVSILISAGSAFNTTGLTNVTYAATGLPPGFTINTRTGRITGTPPAGAATGVARGAYAVTVTAVDERGGRDNFSFPLTVERGSGTPSPTPIPSPSSTPLPEIVAAMPEVAAFDGQVMTPINASTYFKAGGDTSGVLTYSAAGLPPVVVINPQTGVIEGTLAASASSGAANGAYAVTVTARNADGGSVAQTFVLKARIPPIVLSAPTPNLSFVEGNVVDIPAGAAFTIPAHVSGSAQVIYIVAGLPPGLSFSTTTGQITGTIANGAALAGDRGLYTVLVTANDGRTTPVVDDFTLTILARPPEPPAPVIVLNLPSVSVRAGAPIPPLPTAPYFKAGGEATNPLTYFADGLPPRLDIDTATGQIFGSPEVAAVTTAPGGAYVVKVTAIDARAQKSVAQSFTLTVLQPLPVTPPLQPPVLPTPPPPLPPIPPIATPPPVVVPVPPVPPIATPVTPPPAPTPTPPPAPPIPPVVTPAPQPPPAPPLPSPSPPRVVGALAAAMLVEGSAIAPIETAQGFALGSASTGTLAFSARDLPWGLSIDGTSGRITGTVSPSAPIGPYAATVMATDSASSLSTSQPLAITIAARPAPPPPVPPVVTPPVTTPGTTPTPAAEGWWAWIKRKATGWF